MTIIHYKGTNPFRRFGIEHFLEKFSRIFEKELSDRIIVSYFNDYVDSDFNIIILENQIENEIKGHIKTEDLCIPIFEIPVKLKKKDETFAYFYNDLNDRYPCISQINDNSIYISFDIFNEIGHILSGHLEQLWRKESNKSIAKIPLIDYYEQILFDLINFAQIQLDLHQTGKSFWPNGKKFALCLTHDVDRSHKTYQYITHFFKYLKAGNYRASIYQCQSIIEKLRGREPYWNFDEILKIENEHHVKSNFYFLHEQSNPIKNIKDMMLFSGRYQIDKPKIRDMIIKLHEGGWRIGVHGSYNSYINTQLLSSQKKLLEGVIGQEINGIRQHHLNFDIQQTWKLQERSGFKYDSSTGFKNTIGFRYGTSFPFHPVDLESEKLLKIIELPLIIMDGALIFDSDSWDDCVEVIEHVEHVGGVITILWHQRFFNKKEFPKYSDLYEKIIRLCKEKNAWIAPADDIIQWWDSNRYYDKEFTRE